MAPCAFILWWVGKDQCTLLQLILELSEIIFLRQNYLPAGKKTESPASNHQNLCCPSWWQTLLLVQWLNNCYRCRCYADPIEEEVTELMLSLSAWSREEKLRQMQTKRAYQYQMGIVFLQKLELWTKIKKIRKCFRWKNDPINLPNEIYEFVLC